MVLSDISYTTFHNLNFIWIAIGFITFLVLLKINAPYGRHTTAGWGPLISNKLAWFLMEVPVLLIVFTFVFVGNKNLSLPIAIMGILFCGHYFHRAIIFPLRLKTKGKKMPVLIMVSAILFNLVNGSLIGYYLRNFGHYPYGWLTDPRFIFGVLLFLTGLTMNLVSDTILINLRRGENKGYQIPKGFLFEQVSCPNHFGEMLEWLGFALLCWNLPAFGFFVWTVANLLPRAVAHHRWYREKFEDYPAKRRALIPYLL